MLGLRAGRGARIRRDEGKHFSDEADLSLSSVGRMRPRSGAKKRIQKAEFRRQNYFSPPPLIFMDKTGIIVVSLCGALLVWWFVEQNKTAKLQAEYARTHPVAVATNASATTAAAASCY